MGTLWQNAPAISLENGSYDGLTTVSELKRHGDLGIGVFDQLDGEMVGVDGIFYRTTADSKAHVPEDSVMLPFCMVTEFVGEKSWNLPPGTSKDRLAAFADERLPSANFFYALRLDGAFTSLRIRCLPRQEKPFPPLAKVVETQPEFSYGRVEGTMVGFRAAPYAGRLAPPGYHLHFISSDRAFGGHVLFFEEATGTLSADRVERQEILYPATRDFAGKTLA